MKISSGQLEFLSRTELFAGMRSDHMEALLGCLGARVKSFGKGETVVQSGQPIDSLYLLVGGHAHIVRYDLDGTRRVEGELSPGDCFGDIVMCAQLGASDTSMESTAQSMVLVLNYQRVVTTCSSACQFHTRLVQNLMRVIARHSREQAMRLEVLARRTTREKLLHYLEMQAENNYDVEFRIPFSREELATYLYVDRSALSREISKLIDEGVLSVPKRATFMLHVPHKASSNRTLKRQAPRKE